LPLLIEPIRYLAVLVLTFGFAHGWRSAKLARQSYVLGLYKLNLQTKNSDSIFCKLLFMESINLESNSEVPIFKPKLGIFTELQLAEIFLSLEAKKEVSGKYVYFASGVENWAKRSTVIREGLYLNNYKSSNDNNSYKLVEETLGLVLGSLEFYTQVNVIDIGPGTGFQIIPIIAALKEKEQMGKYIAIDIVKEMTDLAIGNIVDQKIITTDDTFQYVHDFEDGNFADLIGEPQKSGTTSLFCFFGSTLGNMINRHQVLVNLRDSMTEGNLLWIGNTLYDSAEYLVNSYDKLKVNSEKYLAVHKPAGSFFESFGIENWWEFGRILVEKDDTFGLVKFNFEVTKPFTLEFPRLNNKDVSRINFAKNEKFTFQRLKNYTESDLVIELKEAGFKIKMLNVAADYKSALILVSV